MQQLGTTVYCFGYSKHGQLGIGETNKQGESEPQKTHRLQNSNTTTVSCGGAFTVALAQNDMIWSWGDYRGDIPTRIASLRGLGLRRVCCGATHTVILTAAGGAYTWGTNLVPPVKSFASKLPQQSVTEPKLLTPAVKDNIFVEVACGALHTLLLTNDNSLYGYGSNTRFQLGIDNVEETITPLRISFKELSSEKISQISCGGSHSVVLTESGKVFTWGDNRYGQLGGGNNDSVKNVVEPKLPSKASFIACGDYHTLVILADGSLYAFGQNKNGQLGIGSTNDTYEPTKVSINTPVRKVAGGGGFGCSHSIAVTQDGAVYTWGSGKNGQLGHGNEDNVLVPTPVKAFQGLPIIDVSCGYLHSCVLTGVVPSFSDSREPALGIFQVLPVEVLELILAKLDVNSLVRLGKTSTYFASITKNEQIWENHFYIRFASYNVDRKLGINLGWKKLYGILTEEIFTTKPIQWDDFRSTNAQPQQAEDIAGFFSGVTKYFTGRKTWSFNSKIKFLMMGLDAAGKTTILYRLKLGEVVTTIPTIGFNVETVDYKNISLIVWDVGGPDKIRPLWRHYYQNTNAIIWVIDSNDKDRLGESILELTKTLNENELRDCVLLLFANKQDLPRALNPFSIAAELGLRPSTLGNPFANFVDRGRKWRIQPCCATSGDGIYEGLDWLSEVLKNT